MVFNGNAPNGSIISWTLPGSSQPNGSGDSILIAYANPSKYPINLTVNNSGCISNISDSILVNPLPLVSIMANNVCNDIPVSFVNNSSITSGSIANSYWNLGDGQTSNLLSPANHNYSTPGVYSITYLAESDRLCKDSTSTIIEVYEMPISDFISDTVCEGNSTTIQSISTLGTGRIVNYEYLYNSQIIGFDSSLSYVFSSSGIHNVMHVVTTDHGCRDTLIDEVMVYSKPIVNFSGGPLNGCQPLDVSFQNLTTNLDGPIDSLTWNFGDGNISSLNTTNHIYEDAGLYDVGLEAISINGCVSDTTFRNYVEVYQNPQAFFVHEPSPTDILYPVIYFKNQSIDGDYYSWNLGDGSLSNESDPIHQYEAAGNYPIQLIASTINGCKDTVYGEVIVNPAYTLYVPNSFTPNNDGRNDFFSCSGIGIVKFKMNIFSRWGNHICTLNDINQSWDGYDDGKLAQEDTYVYLIEVTDILKQEHVISGRVSIIK
jgi:gliding motility-associated-like protein